MDLFDKCRAFTRADEVKASGYYPYFRAIEANEGPVVSIEGRQVQDRRPHVGEEEPAPQCAESLLSADSSEQPSIPLCVCGCGIVDLPGLGVPDSLSRRGPVSGG